MKKYDFAVDSDYEKAIKVFGGYDRIKERYPYIVEVLENTRNKASANSKPLTKAMPNEEPELQYLKDDTWLTINRLDDSKLGDPFGFTMTATVNYTDPHGYILLTGRFLDANTGGVLDTFSISEINTNRIDGTIVSKGLNYSEGMEILVESSVVMADVGSDGNNVFSVVKNATETFILPKNTPASSPMTKSAADPTPPPCIKVINPMPKEGKGPITKIGYGNRSNWSDISYPYPDVEADLVNKVVDIHCPLDGELGPCGVKFKDMGTKPFFRDIKLQLTFVDRTKLGVIKFNNFEKITYKLLNDQTKLIWKFPEDWKTKLEMKHIVALGESNFQLDFYARVSIDNPGGSSYSQDIEVSSNPLFIEDIPNYKRKINKLYIGWGCLGKDTMIRMADGSQKKIDTISIGDMVMTQSKTPKKVTNIITGTEAQMILVQVEGKTEILLSDMHPVVTKDGIIEASRVSAADEMKLQDGSFADLVYLDRVNYNDKVYSLVLEDTDFISANDYWVGDANSKIDTPKAEKVATPLDAKLVAELKKAEEDMFSKLG